MIECYKSKTCVNYEKECHKCMALSDLTNNYPLYETESKCDIHKIIDDAMKKRDRYVHIFITGSSMSITVNPQDDDGMKWIVTGPNKPYGRTKCKCSRCGGESVTTDLYCKHCGEMRTGIIREKKNDNT